MGAWNDCCCFGIVSQSGGWFGDQLNNAAVPNRFYLKKCLTNIAQHWLQQCQSQSRAHARRHAGTHASVKEENGVVVSIREV